MGFDTSLDRMSELPESLLVQILSLLPTQDAFATSILSKRWRYLWTSVDQFLFFSEDDLIPDKESFISFVDYILAHSTCSRIKTFDLDFSDALKNRITRWLRIAVKKQVEHVVLSALIEDDSIDLPKSTIFYNRSTLVALELDHSVPRKNRVIEWKSLKCLKLDFVTLDDGDIVNLLSGCPVLETLVLRVFHGFRRLVINNPNLKRLKLEEYWMPSDEDDHSLEIVAPYIQHLEISHDLKDLKCRLVDVSSVVSAKLTFQMSCTTCPEDHQVIWSLVQDYLQKLSRATELTLGTWFTEVLLQLEFERLRLPELKCKSLTLDLDFRRFYFYGAAILLQASPHVETLNITMETMILDQYRCKFVEGYFLKGEDIHLPSWISSFGFPNLKNVKVVGSSSKCLKNHIERDYDELLGLSAFLLKNAMVLDKFVIKSTRRKCWSCSVNCVSRYLSLLNEKLLCCPRYSTNSEIISQGWA